MRCSQLISVCVKLVGMIELTGGESVKLVLDQPENETNPVIGRFVQLGIRLGWSTQTAVFGGEYEVFYVLS